MVTLRLLLFEECNRKCAGCCNKQFDLENLEKVKTYDGYDEIILTGGEPMLHPEKILSVIKDIRRENKTAKIYVYTAKTDAYQALIDVLYFADGITVTLHTKKDVEPFKRFNMKIPGWLINERSMRLNIFKGVTIDQYLGGWIVKKNIKWIKNCPIPENEIFMRAD